MRKKLLSNPYGLPKSGLIFCWADTHLAFDSNEIINQPFPARFTPGKFWHRLYSVRFPQKILTARKKLFQQIVFVFWQKVKEFSLDLAKKSPELVLFVHLGDRSVPGAGKKTASKSLKAHQQIIKQLRKKISKAYPQSRVGAKFLRGNHEAKNSNYFSSFLQLKNQEEPFLQAIGQFNLIGLNTSLSSFESQADWRLKTLQKKVIALANSSFLPSIVIGHQVLKRLGINRPIIKIGGHYHWPLSIKKIFSWPGFYSIAAPSSNFPLGWKMPFVFWTIIINNDCYKIKKVIIN